MTHKELEAAQAEIAKLPLAVRVLEARARVTAMCSERRGPRMSIPVRATDDDMFICQVLDECAELVGAIHREWWERAGKNLTEERDRAVSWAADREKETKEARELVEVTEHATVASLQSLGGRLIARDRRIQKLREALTTIKDRATAPLATLASDALSGDEVDAS